MGQPALTLGSEGVGALLLEMCVVFTLNRYFYPTTSVHPVPVLIHPGEMEIMWSQAL